LLDDGAAVTAILMLLLARSLLLRAGMITAPCVTACGGAINDDTQPDLTIAAEAQANLNFCLCHHGLGPGLGGELTVRVTNTGGAARRVTLFPPRVRTAAGAQYASQSATYRFVGGRQQSLETPFSLEPGETAHVAFELYVDGPQSLAELGGGASAILEGQTNAGSFKIESTRVAVGDVSKDR
jgi:hypothetical protein